MGVIAKGILRGCQGLSTPVSLGYPLSVFNKKLYSKINTVICPKPIIVHTATSKVTLRLLLCLRALFYFSFLYTYVCVFLHIQSPLRECRWIQSGASGLPYYCAPRVCVSDVMESPAVCWHNKPKTKNL